MSIALRLKGRNRVEGKQKVGTHMWEEVGGFQKRGCFKACPVLQREVSLKGPHWT